MRHMRSPEEHGVGARGSGAQQGMRSITRVWMLCLSDGVPGRSFVAALVVGTVLNLSNQGDTLAAGGAINVTKLLLTFAVPYFVATYGAVSYCMREERRGSKCVSRDRSD